ncbi:MAG: hypothetical protein LKH27_02300 [Prevotella sp.]|jgi:uncharacterized membrane protein YfhO|nr:MULTISPECIES: hypothetical protein [unclassified Prevotella]MCH3968867.1 hypothetical protein [Prevotella sp.]MCH3985277.1 hypothetical protein [Prevotella sp.]MCH3992287.1 hypothetical protein [Prevotella sp.]MCH4017127.1 hypothetical protein [Prevotella sp.]MCH4099954.1 hypothetical protein [Prevotella sp.]
MHPFAYYIFALIVLIVAFLVLKKVASCLIKSVVMIALVVLLAFLYFTYIR